MRFRAEGVTTVASVHAALAEATSKAGPDGEVFVIGGGQIYAETIGIADRLYITEVDAAPDGDAHFPAIDPAEWREVRRDASARAEGTAPRRRGRLRTPLKSGLLKPNPVGPHLKLKAISAGFVCRPPGTCL